MVLLRIAAVLFLVDIAYGFIANDKEEFIIDVTPQCPSVAGVSNATFTLLADVPAYAQATCRGNHTYPFLEVGDGVTFELTVGFDEKVRDKMCIFQKKDGSNTYTVLVELGWGEPEGFLMTHKEQYTVTCAYGGKGNGTSGGHPVDEWLISPKENQRMLGPKSASKFDLQVIDVRGKPFVGSLPMGRWIQLEAISDAKGGEKGIRALSCVAKNEVSSYAILRAGCGDGVIFPKNAGFQTKGLKVFSPYFEGFRLRGSNQLTFICNFTVCGKTCNGNSCPNVVKRSVRRPPVLQLVDKMNDPAIDLASPYLEKSIGIINKEPVIYLTRTLYVVEPKETKPNLLKRITSMDIGAFICLSVVMAILLLSVMVAVCICARLRVHKKPSVVATSMEKIAES